MATTTPSFVFQHPTRVNKEIDLLKKAGRNVRCVDNDENKGVVYEITTTLKGAEKLKIFIPETYPFDFVEYLDLPLGTPEVFVVTDLGAKNPVLHKKEYFNVRINDVITALENKTYVINVKVCK